MLSGRRIVSVWGMRVRQTHRCAAQLRDHVARRLCAVRTHRFGEAEVDVVAQ